VDGEGRTPVTGARYGITMTVELVVVEMWHRMDPPGYHRPDPASTAFP
jgi:hypothetical protein